MNIFLSTPISSFTSTEDLIAYKLQILKLIKALKMTYSVYSEIETINNELNYESPDNAILADLEKIKACDMFILHYPQRIPTSALIELGFAVSFEKPIIVITSQREILPYLILGISATNPMSTIIEAKEINDQLIQKVISLLQL